MAAGATPTIYDPKELFNDLDLPNSDTTEYTAPNEAGVRVEGISVVNKTSSAATVRVWIEDAATNILRYIAYDATILPDGLEHPLVRVPFILDPTNEIHAQAGTASALDIGAWGIEMKD